MKPDEKGEDEDYDPDCPYKVYYSMVSSLYTRPWFYRMWIIQEVAVRTWIDNHERVKFLIGHITVPYSIMSKKRGGWAPQPYIDVLQRVADPENIICSKPETGYTRLVRNGLHDLNDAWYKLQHVFSQLPTATTIQWPTSVQLPYLLCSFSEFKATEPRDRLYALIGLLLGPENMKVPASLFPDYTKPQEDFFHEYSVWMLKNTGIIDILSINSAERTTGPRCPSWVPNFESRRKSFVHDAIVVGEPIPLKFLEDNRVLEADALVISPIHIVAEPWDTTPLEKVSAAHLRGTPSTASRLIEMTRAMLLRWGAMIEMHMLASPYDLGRGRQKLASDGYDLIFALPSYDEGDTPRARLIRYFDLAYKESARGHGRLNWEPGALYNGIFCDKKEDDPVHGMSATMPIVLSYAHRSFLRPLHCERVRSPDGLRHSERRNRLLLQQVLPCAMRRPCLSPQGFIEGVHPTPGPS